MTSNQGGRKRGVYSKDTCPRCGAPRSVQRRQLRRPTIDLSAMRLVDDLHPSDCVVCDRCGVAFRVVTLDVDDGYLMSDDELEFVPSYCPNCGGRIEVGDD